jgi:hypothetical protein
MAPGVLFCILVLAVLGREQQQLTQQWQASPPYWSPPPALPAKEQPSLPNDRPSILYNHPTG